MSKWKLEVREEYPFILWVGNSTMTPRISPDGMSCPVFYHKDRFNSRVRISKYCEQTPELRLIKGQLILGDDYEV